MHSVIAYQQMTEVFYVSKTVVSEHWRMDLLLIKLNHILEVHPVHQPLLMYLPMRSDQNCVEMNPVIPNSLEIESGLSIQCSFLNKLADILLQHFCFSFIKGYLILQHNSRKISLLKFVRHSDGKVMRSLKTLCWNWMPRNIH